MRSSGNTMWEHIEHFDCKRAGFSCLEYNDRLFVVGGFTERCFVLFLMVGSREVLLDRAELQIAMRKSTYGVCRKLALEVLFMWLGAGRKATM